VKQTIKEGQHEKIDRSDGAVVEFEQINFQSKTEDLGGGATPEIQPKNTQGLIGVGYQF